MEDLEKIKSDYKKDINPSGEVPTLLYKGKDKIFESEICSGFIE